MLHARYDPYTVMLDIFPALSLISHTEFYKLMTEPQQKFAKIIERKASSLTLHSVTENDSQLMLGFIFSALCSLMGKTRKNRMLLTENDRINSMQILYDYSIAGLYVLLKKYNGAIMWQPSLSIPKSSSRRSSLNYIDNIISHNPIYWSPDSKSEIIPKIYKYNVATKTIRSFDRYLDIVSNELYFDANMTYKRIVWDAYYETRQFSIVSVFIYRLINFMSELGLMGNLETVSKHASYATPNLLQQVGRTVDDEYAFNSYFWDRPVERKLIYNDNETDSQFIEFVHSNHPGNDDILEMISIYKKLFGIDGDIEKIKTIYKWADEISDLLARKSKINKYNFFRYVSMGIIALNLSMLGYGFDELQKLVGNTKQKLLNIADKLMNANVEITAIIPYVNQEESDELKFDFYLHADKNDKVTLTPDDISIIRKVEINRWG